MEGPRTPDSYTEGGWSSPAEDDSSSSDSDRSVDSTSAASEQLISTCEDLAEPVTEPTTAAFKEADLLELLRRRLEHGGLLPHNWAFNINNSDNAIAPDNLPYPRLFQCLGKSVAQTDLLESWITSADTNLFCLQIPNGLHNPFLVTSIVNALAMLQPYLQVTAAIIGNDCSMLQQAPLEQLLMSLCFGLLSNGGLGSSWDYSEILGDLRDAFASLNNDWRESMLWTLLQYLLTNGENKHQVLALSFPIDSPNAQTFRPIIEQLLHLAKSTERNIQIIILHSCDNNLTFDTPYRTTINMMDGGTQESLRTDISSWFDGAIRARPSLRTLREQILLPLLRQLDQPLVAFSALYALQNRPWISEYQLMAGHTLLGSMDLLLQRIPECDRPLAADVLGILCYCSRPLRTTELAEALFTAQYLSSITESKERLIINIEFDLRQMLPGLVYIESDLVWSLFSHLTCSSAQDQRSPEKTPAWLDLGPNAEMRLASICLRYISSWSQLNTVEGVPNVSKNNVDKQGYFLNYATFFWFHHYSRAHQRGASGKEIVQLLQDKPGLIQLWFDLQCAFEPLRIRVTDQVKVAGTSWFSPIHMAREFDIEIHDAIAVVNMASQTLTAMENDLPSAMALSRWHFRCQMAETNALAWIEENKIQLNPKSLTQAFAIIPKTAFDLLLASQDGIKQNASLVLSTAIRQGDSLIVEECLRHMNPDIQSITAISSPLEGRWVSVLQAVLGHELKHLNDEQMIRTTGGLLCKAVKYNQLELVGLLLNYDLNLAQLESEDILSVAAETGNLDVVQQISSRKAAINAALHTASNYNFLNISRFLLANGASVTRKGNRRATPVHVAAKAGHFDMVQLLITANGERLTDNQSGLSEDKKQHLHSPKELVGNLNTGDDVLEIEDGDGYLPIEVAIISQHEAIVELLLENTRMSTILSREFLHIATRYKNIKLVRRLLKMPGFNPSRQDKKGRTALEIACVMGSVAIAQELLERGAMPWPAKNGPFYALMNLSHTKDKPAALSIAHLLTSGNHKPDKCVLNSLLLDAAGNTDIMIILLDAGADINYATKSLNRTCLHKCARYNYENTTRVLLMRGAARNLIDSHGDSPLADATSKRHLNIMRLLLEAGERYPLNGTGCPLVRLTQGGEIASLEVILKHQEEFRGAQVLSECFHVALRNNDFKIVLLLLDYDANPYSESTRRRYGNAINECAYYGNIKMARALLSHPSKVGDNTVNSETGQYYTPLIAAVSWQHSQQRVSANKERLNRRLTKQRKMIDYLIREGGNPKAVGGRYGSMLNAAAAGGKPELVAYILDKIGFKIDEIDHEGRNAAHMASSSLNVSDRVDVLRLLSERIGGPQLMLTPDDHGRLPLHFACGGQRLDVFIYLLREHNQGKINFPDKDGWTPLHWACREWDVLFVRLLVEAGAKTDCVDNNGWTPWDVAVFHDNTGFAFELGRQSFEPDKNGVVKKEAVRSAARCDSCQVSKKFPQFEVMI
ncbi:hypothetical protein SAMD00023353_13200050 [Rosellinia necatrix]|uniref:Uncharacterized protein n=1 Tax=Rosellinia necatrix TaxID=77044 RepID=A0A1W2TXK9_ROSNE|nr:hypothetical protein SAMD00023353_13200050 [Rosellinia necatrix]